MNDREQTEAWSLVAGDVALDFVNMIGGNDSTADLDAIATYGPPSPRPSPRPNRSPTAARSSGAGPA